MVKKKCCVFISGKGTNLSALIKSTREYNFPVNINFIISSTLNAKGLNLAKKYSIKYHVYKINKKKELEIILNELKKRKISLICLAGYMKILPEEFINRFRGKIINIHPSLLPLFKGLDTHRRALKSGMALHGATVHIVTPHLDSGKILGQIVVPIVKGDTEKELKKRVLKAEHQLYPVVLRRVLLGKISAPILLEL